MRCIVGVSLRGRLGRGRGRTGCVRGLGGFISFCLIRGGGKGMGRWMRLRLMSGGRMGDGDGGWILGFGYGYGYG